MTQIQNRFFSITNCCDSTHASMLSDAANSESSRWHEGIVPVSSSDQFIKCILLYSTCTCKVGPKLQKEMINCSKAILILISIGFLSFRSDFVLFHFAFNIICHKLVCFVVYLQSVPQNIYFRFPFCSVPTAIAD